MGLQPTQNSELIPGKAQCRRPLRLPAAKAGKAQDRKNTFYAFLLFLFYVSQIRRLLRSAISLLYFFLQTAGSYGAGVVSSLRRSVLFIVKFRKRRSRSLPCRQAGVGAVCLIFFCSTAFAQSPVQDSTSRDSLNKAFINQVKQNEAAQGIDTTHFATPETEATTTDSSSTKTDSVMLAKKRLRHSPKKAGWFSAALPGLGQAYNKKYWKIPIIYAGFGGIGYAIYFTSSNFYGYRAAYRAQVATVPDVTASYNGITDPGTLKEYRDYYKSNYDISVIVAGVWYMLNIVDAVVDAHLFEWNMKNDISVSWQPGVINNTTATNGTAFGASIRIGF